jgi:predicted ATP-dependent protease
MVFLHVKVRQWLVASLRLYTQQRCSAATCMACPACDHGKAHWTRPYCVAVRIVMAASDMQRDKEVQFYIEVPAVTPVSEVATQAAEMHNLIRRIQRYADRIRPSNPSALLQSVFGCVRAACGLCAVRAGILSMQNLQRGRALRTARPTVFRAHPRARASRL